MSLGNVDLLNKVANSTAFTTATGNNTHSEGETITEFLSFDGNGNSVTVKDSDNETFNLSLSALAEELGMSLDALKEELGVDKLAETTETGTAEETKGTAETEKTGETKTSDAIQKEIDALNADKTDSMAQLKALETTIKDLSETIEKKLEEAAKKQEIKIEEHQEAVEKAIADNVAKYIEASKTDKPMTQEELQSGIKSSIAGIEGIPSGADDVLSNLFVINSELSLLDANLAKVKTLTDHVKDIDTQIQGKTNELKAAKEAEAAAQAQQQECCPRPDPIGFQMKDAEGNEIQVDFFIDRDDDGKLTDASEFLGAVADAEGKDGWSEMQALNKNGDDKIDAEELKDAENAEDKLGGELKVMVTIGDEQIPMSIAEFEAKYGPIEINANKDQETNTEVGPKNFEDEQYENERLGSFGLTVGGQELSGYQTRDDMDYLNDNYDFSSGSAEGVDGSALKIGETTAPAPVDGTEEVDGAEETEETEGLDYFESFYETYTEKAKELRESLEHLWTMQGLNEEYIELIDKSAFIIAENKTADVKTKAETEEAEGEAEGDGEVDETTEGVGEVDETTGEGADEEDPDKKPEEEEEPVA